MTRVLVTGAGGFIGRFALHSLTARGHEVHAVSRRRRSEPDGVTWHEADLLEGESGAEVVAEVAPSHLLHLAWCTEPGEYWTSSKNVDWVRASLGLLDAFAAAGGRRAVIAGTCAEYDWSDGLCVEDETSLRPSTPYGRAKDELRERAFARGADAGLSVAWGRIFFLYGPGEHPGRLVASVARALLAGEPAQTTAGEQRRDFLHVADVAEAFASLLDSPVEAPVNIASGEAVAVRDVVTLVARAAERPDLLELGALPPRPDEPPLIVGDVRRLRDEVGFSPSLTLEEGIHETVARLRAEA